MSGKEPEIREMELDEETGKRVEELNQKLKERRENREEENTIEVEPGGELDQLLNELKEESEDEKKNINFKKENN